MKKDAGDKLPIYMLYGFSALFGAIALICLFSGAWPAFLGLMVFCLGFGGFGWAMRRLTRPKDDESSGDSVGLIALVMFGGAGAVMVIGSFFLFADDQIGGGIGLALFGSVFGGVGYKAWRGFSVPRGMKEVKMVETTRPLVRGDRVCGEVTDSDYTLMDENASPEEIAAKQRAWVEQPWTQRDDWRAGKIAQEGAGSGRLLVIFTVVWNLFSWGMTVAIASSGDFPLLMLLFPAMGVLLAVMTVREIIRKRKFGLSVLHLQTMPAWLGERCLGMVQTHLRASVHMPEFSVCLACVEKSVSRRNDTSERGIWNRAQTVKGQVGDHFTVEIPLDLAVPADQPATVMQPISQRILWRLTISREVPGVDYLAVFEIPVFRKPGRASVVG